MTGKIIKGIAGFYYVHTAMDEIYACKARGLFRKDGIKPLVGDNVEFQILSEEEKEGSIRHVLPRNNVLIRPAVANIDRALIVFAVREPDPNLNLLDRFLIYMGMQEIPVTVYFNKNDLDRDGETERYRRIYEAAGYEVFCGSLLSGSFAEEIYGILRGRTTVLAGPSGVGKSSLTNLIHKDAGMEVGSLSEKIKRGKQTTRHTELFTVDCNTYLLDTPGFTSLTLPKTLPAEEIRDYYSEFGAYRSGCRFSGCVHVNEQEAICGVKQALADGRIDPVRYENYLQIYEEQKKNQRY